MRKEGTAAELGYKLGDKFEVLENDGWFSAGDQVELARDDDSMNPWFKGLNGCKDGYGIIGWMKKINTNGEESSTMTPCEKLGYKVGDEFVCTDTMWFDRGSKCTLIRDDGTSVPRFSGFLRYSRTYRFVSLDNVKPINNQE